MRILNCGMTTRIESEGPAIEQRQLEVLGPSMNLSPVVDGKEYCPICGRVLFPFHCKLRCECGYFLSCSEF